MEPHLIQNTEAWASYRKGKVGASDAPVIMGVSPWKTITQLWEEKCGLKTNDYTNAAMQRGHDMEPIALAAYNRRTGNNSEPKVLVHPDLPWMSCSLDGLSEDGTIATEIKNPGIADHELAKSGKVPEKYYPQLQHQLAILGHYVIHYYSFRDGDEVLIEVPRDDAYIAELINKELAFWKCVKNFEMPDDPKSVTIKEDKEWIANAKRWKEVSAQIKQLQEEEKFYRQQLISLSDDVSCMGAGIRLSKVVRAGNVDYKKIPELEGVDLDAYRKEPSVSWRLSECKQEKTYESNSA